MTMSLQNLFGNIIKGGRVGTKNKKIEVEETFKIRKSRTIGKYEIIIIGNMIYIMQLK